LDRAGTARKGRRLILKLANEQSSATGLQNATVKKNTIIRFVAIGLDGDWINEKRDLKNNSH
jgi:hypothetical protein